jgi:hypothetical protein
VWKSVPHSIEALEHAQLTVGFPEPNAGQAIKRQ